MERVDRRTVEEHFDLYYLKKIGPFRMTDPRNYGTADGRTHMRGAENSRPMVRPTDLPLIFNKLQYTTHNAM